MWDSSRTAATVLVHLACTLVLLSYIADTAMPFYVYRRETFSDEIASGSSASTQSVHSWDRWPLLFEWNKTAYAARVAQHQRSSSVADVVALNASVVWRSSLFHLTLAAVTYVLLTYYVTAPFGRHANDIRPLLSLPARVSWMLQESPTILQVLYHVLVEYPRLMGHSPTLPSWSSLSFFFVNSSLGKVAVVKSSNDTCQSYWSCVRVACTHQHIGLLLFLMHYIHRSWIYPLSIPTRAHRVPLLITSTATLYCLFNGRLQVLASAGAASAADATVPSSLCSAPYLRSIGFWECWGKRRELSSLSASFPLEANAVEVGWMLLLCVYAVGLSGGFALFFFGGAVNIKADYYLMGLRDSGKVNSKDDAKVSAQQSRAKERDGGSEYRIPFGGWFDYVSCANFLGEVMEWAGYVMVVSATSAVSNGSCRSISVALDEEVRRLLSSSSSSSSSSSFGALFNIPMWVRLIARVFWSATDSNPAALAAFSFFIYVLSNLAPRAVAHHAWYGKTFGERYTKLNRRALIPGVY